MLIIAKHRGTNPVTMAALNTETMESMYRGHSGMLEQWTSAVAVEKGKPGEVANVINNSPYWERLW